MISRFRIAIQIQIVAALALGCRPRDISSRSSVNDVGITGSDLPPAGRSLFDRLMYDETAHDYIIPTRFEDLIDRVRDRSKANGMNGVFLPFGRSLQKMASYPEFFKYPRVVVQADFSRAALLPNRDFGYRRGQLYLGYVEPAKTVEVISYNAEAGRFEFQLIENYGKGLKPKLVYALRDRCFACHQTGAPIFSTNDWSETNSNLEVLKVESLAEIKDQSPVLSKLLLAHPNNDYLGFPIRPISVDERYGLFFVDRFAPRYVFTSSQRFDDVVRLSHDMQFINHIWTDLCAARPEGAARCRADLLQDGLLQNLSVRGGDGVVHKSRRWLVDELRRNGGRGYPSAFLADREPQFQDPHAALPEKLNPRNRRSAYEDFSSPGRGFAGGAPHNIYLNVGNATAPAAFIEDLDNYISMQLIYETFYQQKKPMGWVSEAVETMLKNRDSSLHKNVFDRCNLAQELTGALNLAEPIRGCAHDDLPLSQSLPPPILETKPATILDGTQQPVLKALNNHCGACHGNGTSPEFLSGLDEDQVWQDLRKSKFRLLRVLKERSMPPEGTKHAINFWKDTNDGTQQNIMTTIDALKAL